MSSSQPTDADNTKRGQHRRRGRLSGACLVAFFGLIAFYSVASNPRFETIHTPDVIRLIVAGAAIPVTIMLLIQFFNVPGPPSRI